MAKKTDADYLKSEEIGLVIAKGMATMYNENPKNPVDYLAKWLLNYSQVERAQERQIEAKRIVHEHVEKHQDDLVKAESTKDEEKKQADAVEQGKKDFLKQVTESKDLNDELQNMADHLKEQTGSTAVYVGRLVAPKKPINDTDDDMAHLDEGSEKMILFSHASKDSEWMVKKTLKKGTGLTFDVFEDKLDDEGKPIVSEDPCHTLVKEVVREPKIHFYKVPKLGSYLAIRLEYDSCLFVESYNEGLKDYLNMKTRQAEQEEQKKEHEERERERKEQCEADEAEYVYEPGNWPEIKAKSFKTQKVSLVVCLNTMGQDRCFQESEIRFALDQVKNFTKEWQRIENENLTADIMRKVNAQDFERVYKETYEAQDIAELERRAEEATLPQEGQEVLTEDDKNLVAKKTKLQSLMKQFKDPDGLAAHQKMVDRDRARTTSQDRDRSGTPNTSHHGEAGAGHEEKYYPVAPEYWRQAFLDMKDQHILKMPRVLQTLFYLLRYSREEICEENTNKLDFKKVKELIGDDLFDRMAAYDPLGPSDIEYAPYHKLAFLKKNIDSCNEEAVEEFSLVMSKIYKWVALAIETRTEDVVKRKNIKAIQKNERDQALTADADRTKKREDELAAANAEWDTLQTEAAEKHLAEQDDHDEDGNPVEKTEYEKEPFDLEGFDAKFDGENPPIDIPEPVMDEVDNDFDLPWSPPDLGE